MAGRLTGSDNAFSIIEVMMACFVLAVVTASISIVLDNAERIHDRARSLSAAEILASGEMERIRLIAWRRETITDTTYETTVNRQTFVVSRQRLNAPLMLMEIDTFTREVVVSVGKKSQERPLVSIRVLQGYE